MRKRTRTHPLLLLSLSPLLHNRMEIVHKEMKRISCQEYKLTIHDAYSSHILFCNHTDLIFLYMEIFIMSHFVNKYPSMRLHLMFETRTPTIARAFLCNILSIYIHLLSLVCFSFIILSLYFFLFGLHAMDKMGILGWILNFIHLLLLLFLSSISMYWFFVILYFLCRFSYRISTYVS